MRVGFIGLGSQGGPMARRIVEGGYELTLWARRPATVEPYADTAAKTAATPAELGAASDLVCLCVVGDDDVQRGAQRRDRGAGRTGAGRDRRHPQHRASRHLPRDRGTGCRTRCFGHRRPGQRRRARGRAGHADGHGRRRGGRRRASAVRCSRRTPTPIVHLGALGSGQVAKILNNLLFSANLGSAMSTLELGDRARHPPRPALRGAQPRVATSKAISSITVFGGTLEGLAPIAGALLQKDVRHAASLADARVGTGGLGVRRAADTARVDAGR